MKLFLFSAVLLLFCLSTQAQSPQTHKIVYLKNGTNIKGTVTVNDSAGYVMIVDNYKETYYYQKNMVAKIVDDDITLKRSYNLKSKGYIFTVEIGGTEIINPDAGSIAAFSFDVINSYLISPIASIGLGVGESWEVIVLRLFLCMPIAGLILLNLTSARFLTLVSDILLYFQITAIIMVMAILRIALLTV